MIWLMLAVLLALVLAYLTVPFWRAADQAGPGADEALVEARAQLAQIDRELAAGRLTENVANETRRALELRVLALLDGASGDGAVTSLMPRRTGLIVAGLFGVATIGLYLELGTPALQHSGRGDEQIVDAEPGVLALEDLVVELQTKLAADPTPPAEGYVLLARSLMTLDRYDEAFAAYETALQLGAQNAAIVDEYAGARAFVDRLAAAPGPDAAAIANAEAMSADERQEMIDGMVAGLAERLTEAPDDPDGWVRLIRARIVMGQIEAASADLAEAARVFEDQPDKRAFVIDAVAAQGLTLSE